MPLQASLLRAAWNHKGKALNAGLGLWFGADTYQEARESGDGAVSAGFQAAKEVALGSMLGLGGYLAYSLVTEAPGIAMDAYLGYHERSRQVGREMMNAGRAFSDSRFNDTEQAYTMRQAGMEIAKRSRYNTQQAMLGNEAKYMMK